MEYGNQFSVTKSFYDWCVENNRMDLNDRFDEEKNCCTTKDVGYKSNLKWWFKCARGLHESEQRFMSAITNNPKTKMLCHKCGSLAQVVIDKFGEDYLWSHWHEDNILDPWEITASSSDGKIKVKIQCQVKDYHVYDQVPASFANGVGCPYCINRKVHPNDSFAVTFPEMIDRWSDKNDKSPWEYAPHSEAKVWFKCPIGKHQDYEQKICNAFTYGFRCKECSLDATRGPEDLVGKVFGRLTVVSLDTESKQSFTDKGNIRYRWWCKCSCGNKKLKSVLGGHLTTDKIRSCGCLYYENSSQLQLKIDHYINENYNCEMNHEYDCELITINPNTNYQLPYDNELIFQNGERLIIECMGEQHYRVTNFAVQAASEKGVTPEEELANLQWRDEYKKQFALDSGYYYLAIPYTAEKDEYYKTMIDSKINEILSSNEINLLPSLKEENINAEI